MINYSLAYRTVKVADLDSNGNKQYDSAGDVVKKSVQKAYANVQSSGNKSEIEFDKLVAAETVYSRADVQGVLDAVAQGLEAQLLEGNRVYLDEMGAFYPSISSKGVEDSRDFNSSTHINKAYAGWSKPSDMASLQNVTYNYIATEAAAALAGANPAAATVGLSLSTSAALAAANLSTLRANYTITVSIAANQQSMGVVTGGGSYKYGTEIKLTATPNTGYKFFKWTDGNRNASRGVIVTQAMSYTAKFGTPSSMTVTSLVNYTGGSAIAKGASLSKLKITASNEVESSGLSLVKIDANGNETALTSVTYEQEDDTTGSFTFATALTLGSDIVALGVVKGDELVYTVALASSSSDSGNSGNATTYSISLSASPEAGGSVGSGQATATAGTTVRITASANSGYTFTKWSDDNTNATRDIVVNSDVTLQAIFTANSSGDGDNSGGSDDGNGDM